MKTLSLDRVFVDVLPYDITSLKFSIDGKSYKIRVLAHPNLTDPKVFFKRVLVSFKNTHNIIFNDDEKQLLKKELSKIKTIYNPTLDDEINLAKQQVKIQWLNWEKIKKKAESLGNVITINK